MKAVHIRRPQPRQTRNQSYSDYRRRRNEELRADYRPDRSGTYCGAPETSRDWDRRSAVAKVNAEAAAKECCPDCLATARKESEVAA